MKKFIQTQYYIKLNEIYTYILRVQEPNRAEYCQVQIWLV